MARFLKVRPWLAIGQKISRVKIFPSWTGRGFTLPPWTNELLAVRPLEWTDFSFKSKSDAIYWAKYTEMQRTDLYPAPICPSSTLCTIPIRTPSVPAHPYHTAPSDVYHCSSEKPCSYPSKHNQFLLQWSTMWLLQPLTLPSILPLFTPAAPGCATQMGLSSAMKWARFVRVCCVYCTCMCSRRTAAVAGGGEDSVWYILVGCVRESPQDKLVWFPIPVCQTEGRSAVWLCQSLAMPPKDNKGNIDVSASWCGIQFFFSWRNQGLFSLLHNKLLDAVSCCYYHSF